MTPHYKQQFPSYDSTLPNLAGWEDDSWGNDTSPKLIRKIEDEFGTVYGILWCDWEEKVSREMLGPRFTLCAADDELTIFHEKNRLEITGETIEALRSNAVQWLLDNVGDSILEEDLTTSEVLTRVVTMWAFHNMKPGQAWKKHAASTGGGCQAYVFEFASKEVLVSTLDGTGLPPDDESTKIVCVFAEGSEKACIAVIASMEDLVKFLTEIGADVF